MARHGLSSVPPAASPSRGTPVHPDALTAIVALIADAVAARLLAHEVQPARLVAPTLLTVPALAQYLGLGKTAAYALISRREIPVVRTGRSVRVRREDAERYLAERTTIARIGGAR